MARIARKPSHGCSARWGCSWWRESIPRFRCTSGSSSIRSLSPGGSIPDFSHATAFWPIRNSGGLRLQNVLYVLCLLCPRPFLEEEVGAANINKALLLGGASAANGIKGLHLMVWLFLRF